MFGMNRVISLVHAINETILKMETKRKQKKVAEKFKPLSKTLSCIKFDNSLTLYSPPSFYLTWNIYIYIYIYTLTLPDISIWSPSNIFISFIKSVIFNETCKAPQCSHLLNWIQILLSYIKYKFNQKKTLKKPQKLLKFSFIKRTLLFCCYHCFTDSLDFFYPRLEIVLLSFLAKVASGEPHFLDC